MVQLSRSDRLFRFAGMFAVSLIVASCGGGGSGGDTPPPPPAADTTAPSVPSNVVFTATSSTSARVSWTPSTDPTVSGATTSGMSGYLVRRCEGAGCAPSVTYASPAVPETVFDGLTPGSVYRVTVVANDLAGNPSAPSAVAEVALPSLPPPPPPGDTTPPQVALVSPAADQLAVNPSVGQVIVEMSERVQCPTSSPNAVTLTGGSMRVSGVLTCGVDAQSNTLFLGFGSARLLYGTVYTVTITGVQDLAGNVMAAAHTSQFTTALSPARTTRLYTANSGATATNGAEYVSSIDPSNGYAVGHVTFGATAFQTLIAADGAAGKVYSAGVNTARGIDVIDVATGATTGISLDPDPTQFEHFGALAIGPTGLYAAYSMVSSQSTLRNRVFRFDRLNQVELARSGQLPNDAMTPTALVVHPDPTAKRLYVFSGTMSAMNVINAGCGGILDYRPGTVGTVTELHAETLATLRIFSVGSVPTSGVVDQSANRLIVGNAGDRTFSVIDLATGAVVTTARPASFTGCRQPGGMTLDASGRLWVSNSQDGVHAFSATLTEIVLVPTGTLSLPYGLTSADGRLYAALDGFGYNSVAEITGTSLTRTIAVGLNPVAITAFVPNQ